MKEPPAYFDASQAAAVIEQWLIDADKLHWTLYNAAVMATHFHLTVAAPRAVNKEDFLRTFKSRASFALNRRFGERTWWTAGGSVRYSKDEQTVRNRIRYVQTQSKQLAYWER